MMPIFYFFFVGGVKINLKSIYIKKNIHDLKDSFDFNTKCLFINGIQDHTSSVVSRESSSKLNTASVSISSYG